MSILTISLVGNPNCGKSTLFNALTQGKQKVGNWPGVTVDCKAGQFVHLQQQINVIDLPGIYQIAFSENLQAIDEKIACEFISQQRPDMVINIVDAAHLERHLYLTLQLLTQGVPLILAVNMMDVASRRNIKLNLPLLQELLGCPVIGLVANKGMGIQELKTAIIHYQQPDKRQLIQYPDCLEKAIGEISASIAIAHSEHSSSSEWLAQQLLQDNEVPFKINHDIMALTNNLRKKIEETLGEEVDLIIADVFYTTAHEIVTTVTSLPGQQKTISDRIDKIVLNRFLGIPIFLATMYCMFLFAINLGGAFQDFFDISSDAIFVQGLTNLLNAFQAPPWLVAILAAGLGRGINTTISFVPVIAGMFFFLAFLEGSGYMARASFVIDRLMRAIGLPGKSFVPMIVGFGCNVPAILAARTLENPRDRALTILMSPFMSCGARLAIFAVFTAAFFPAGGQNIVFALYFIGVIAAIATGFILQKTLLPGELTPLVLELPAYHLPSITILCRQTWERLKGFIFRAGKLIVPVCMLIGTLNVVDLNGSLNYNSASTSTLAAIGRFVTPALQPMGISEENWPATVGLVTGVLAKEVVVATLNTLYSEEAHVANEKKQPPSIRTNLGAAVHSVPANLRALKDSFTNPIIASIPEHTLNHHVYGVMYERFGGQAAAFAYLLFVLLYFPCVSATAVMAKELNKKWTLFSVAWSTGIAYGVATCFYQIATFHAHPLQSFIITASVVITSGVVLSIMRGYTSNKEQRNLKLCC